MAMLKKLADNLALTGTAIGAAVSMNVTPFQGNPGEGKRTAICRLSAAPGGAAVLKIQGHDQMQGTPASGDAGWYDIHSFTAATDTVREIPLSRWMRTNVSTLGTGTTDVDLEGVQ